MSKINSYNNASSDAPPEYPQNSQAPSQGFNGPPSNAGYYGYDSNATQGQQVHAGGGPLGHQFPGQNQQYPMPPPQQAGPNQQYNPPSHYGAGAAYPGMAVCAHSNPHSCLHMFTEAHTTYKQPNLCQMAQCHLMDTHHKDLLRTLHIISNSANNLRSISSHLSML